MENDKNSIPNRHFVESAAYLLRETFEGSPDGKASAYLDRGVGFFSTIGGVSAAAASEYFHGTTIAAQTEHAKFYLDRLCEFMTGRAEKVNWEDSWLIETVNDEEWDALRGTLRQTYEKTLICFATVEEWPEDRLGEAVAMVAHTAYHLGAIRQIAKAVGSETVAAQVIELGS
jgi:hypothetical protein